MTIFSCQVQPGRSDVHADVTDRYDVRPRTSRQNVPRVQGPQTFRARLQSTGGEILRVQLFTYTTNLARTCDDNALEAARVLLTLTDDTLNVCIYFRSCLNFE